VLLNLYAERIMREAELENDEVEIPTGGMLINNIRYADNTTLKVSSGKHLQHMIELVQTASERVCLFLNVSKIKVMTMAQLQHFKVKGVDIEVLSNLKFLGIVINIEGR